jgi:hypothetical protein
MQEQTTDRRGVAAAAEQYDRNQEQWKLANYLARRVCDRASGRLEDECLRNHPHDTYFVGNLRNADDAQDLLLGATDDAFSEMQNKLAPVAFGADMRMRSVEDAVEIATTVEWAAYYRVFPTLAQQREHQLGSQASPEADAPIQATDDGCQNDAEASGTLASVEEEDEQTLLAEAEREELLAEQESPEVVESAADRRSDRKSRDDTLFVRFRKVVCRAEGRIVVRLGGPGAPSVDVRGMQKALDAEVDRARREALSDPDLLRTMGLPHERVGIPAEALNDDASYGTLLNTFTNAVKPEWKWRVEAEVWQENDGAEQHLSMKFVNVSPSQEPPVHPEDSQTNRRRNKVNANVEPFLFDAKASFALEGGELLPFEIDLAPRGFRYDRNMWGRGFNCAVQAVEGQPNALETTSAPVYEQMRYSTRTDPPARFDDLARDPVPVLDAILEAMENYLGRWDSVRRSFVNSEPSWEATHGADFDRDKRVFEDEIARFRRGRDLIRDDDDVRLAFQLTNETFRRTGADPRPEKSDKVSWRLFQIVFLVSQLPGMAALAAPKSSDASELEQVDIVYFPTGGGKTEAYLAAMVFHCFFDRLRGKAAGVTAWIRFPLRLLTLQQTQRVADVMAMAELVRREQSDDVRLTGSTVAAFSVGYFVGSEATPNELLDPDKVYSPKDRDRTNWSVANDRKARQRWRRLIYCPACRQKSVDVAFDSTKVQLIHRCTNDGCVFARGMPVYVVDNEVYRRLPSVIVGTIDKLASIGNQRKMSLLFGNVDGKCERHGYYKDKCCQKDCRDSDLLRPGVPAGLSGPTLFVQDELHLLNEGLGTFDGHYETFVQELRKLSGENTPLKVIASSATIEKFERQVEHLYGREQRQARVFPGLGPTLSESFYAQTLKYPQRIFVGVIPHNKTIFNTVLELIESYHRETQQLRRIASGESNPYGGQLNPGTEEWLRLVDLYVTSLTYFSVGRILNSIRTDLGSDVNRSLERDGFGALDVRELTGGTSTDEVTTILEHLEQPADGNAATGDAVLATNMISHGVDVDRLNAMIFYGMPRQTAEYIQASSRVGRANVGLVFGCMHPVRERDQSHYRYFVKYHEYMGQLVEPVAINRWAKYSIHRTLPGLFMGVLLQVLANRDPGNGNRYYIKEFVQQKINTGEITSDDFVPILERAYRVDNSNTVEATAFRREIHDKVQRFLDQIQAQSFDSGFASESLRPYKPMMSLRDVDEPVDIELDSTGAAWASRSSVR